MTCGSRIVPNGPQNIMAHTMGMSSLKGPQAVSGTFKNGRPTEYSLKSLLGFSIGIIRPLGKSDKLPDLRKTLLFHSRVDR